MESNSGNSKRTAFVNDILAVYAKHGLTLEHESGEGDFVITAYDAGRADRLSGASYHPSVTHEADEWIAAQWVGKAVRQASGIPELVGRTGNVVSTFWDEKGALHCEVVRPGALAGGFWCPASMLVGV